MHLFLQEYNSIILNAWFCSLYMLDCYPFPNCKPEGTVLYFFTWTQNVTIMVTLAELSV